MDTLKQFFRDILSESSYTMPRNVCERTPKQNMETNLNARTYGSFHLTKAVKPAFDLPVVPRQGFRHTVYRGEDNNGMIPVLRASISADRLWDTFMELLDPLGDMVDIVLETSHRYSGGGRSDLYREKIDLSILKSFLYDFEDILLNDGALGIGVINTNIPVEILFDDHKILNIYAEDASAFERILRRNGIHRDESLRFLNEAEHIHLTNDGFIRQFQRLKNTLGIGEECHVAP